MTNEIKLQNYSITEQEAHFYNDVKYVTVSLERERNQVLEKFQSDILTLDVVSMRERFQKEYQEMFYSIKNKLHNQMLQYHAIDLLQFIKQILVQLENGYQQLIKMEEVSRNIQERYQLSYYTIRNLIDFLVLSMQIEKDTKPTAAWFVEANYEAVIEMIDLTQTKVEDYKKAEKRLGKVWKDEIFQEETMPLVERFHSVNKGGFRYFHSFYWKQKKYFRSLFKEDLELLNEQEYEVLYQNLLIYHECKTWLDKDSKKIDSLLGENYQKEETAFHKLRKEYDSIYRFLHLLSIELPMNCIKELLKEDGIRKLKELIGTWINEEDKERLYELENIPLADTNKIMDLSLPEGTNLLYRLMENCQRFTKDIERMLSLAYKKGEGLTIAEVRKYLLLMERIKQKEEWLLANQDRIEEVFGGHYRKYSTDWEEVKQYLLASKQPKNYGFSFYIEAINPFIEVEPELTNEYVWKICETVLLAEHPIKEEIFQKRVVKLLGQKRITTKLKDSMKSYLENNLIVGFVLKEGVLQKEDSTDYNLRINLPENGRREIEGIPECELCSGIVSIIRVEKEITLDEISKIIAEQLGYPRRTKTFHNAIEGIVKRLKQENKIVRHSGGWRICE